MTELNLVSTHVWVFAEVWALFEVNLTCNNNKSKNTDIFIYGKIARHLHFHIPRNTSTFTSLCSLQVEPFFKKQLLNLGLNRKSIYLLFAALLTELVIPSAFVQMQRELHLGAALVVQEALERHQHSLWVHHLLTDLSTHPIFQKAVEDNHQRQMLCSSLRLIVHFFPYTFTRVS